MRAEILHFYTQITPKVSSLQFKDFPYILSMIDVKMCYHSFFFLLGNP